MDQTNTPMRRRPYKIRGPKTWAVIRRAYVAGWSGRLLAERYGVTHDAIRQRAFRGQWRQQDVPDEPAPWPMLPEAGRFVGGAAPSTASRSPSPALAGEEPGGVEAARPALVLRAAQRAPEGDWMTWLFLGGRGAGKTLAGAEWVAERARRVGRIALVGGTLHDVREVMVEGPSGIRGLARYDAPERPEWGRPVYEPTRRRLLWPNGAVAYAFSSEDPESLRGPQHGAAWADELCVWRQPDETLALLRMGLRLGDDPRLVVTTTPKPTAALRRLRAEAGCRETHAPTADNAAHLPPAFLAGLTALYGGTRRAAQELDGVLLAQEGALWRAEDLAACRGGRPARFDRVVVGVDPPGSAGGNACGIVVAGRLGDRAWVLADRTAGGLSPLGWAERVAAAAAEFGASEVVAEKNQGGDMVRTVLAGAGVTVDITLVHAAVGKRARAEPVAALYEQGRVTHCGAWPQLEEELMGLGEDPHGGGGRDSPASSPDRADALVWAISALMLGPKRAEPRIRRL